MSLPFLAPKKQASIIVMKAHDGKQEPMHEEGEAAPELVSFMEELANAVHAKDHHAAAEAFEAAFRYLESQPHEEAGE